MINNPIMIKQLLENFNKIPKKIIKEAVKEVIQENKGSEAMSKADENKELEEAKEVLKMWNKAEEFVINESTHYDKTPYIQRKQAIETVLTALEKYEKQLDLNYIDENYIPKKLIEEYLKEEKERFEVYKKESKENENLKLGMWKHLGAKNMCERILGIEKNIATLD